MSAQLVQTRWSIAVFVASGQTCHDHPNLCNNRLSCMYSNSPASTMYRNARLIKFAWTPMPANAYMILSSFTKLLMAILRLISTWTLCISAFCSSVNTWAVVQKQHRSTPPEVCITDHEVFLAFISLQAGQVAPAGASLQHCLQCMD